MYTLIFRAILPEAPVSQLFSIFCTISKREGPHRKGWGTTRALWELRKQPRSRGTERSFPLNVDSGSELHPASLTHLQAPATPPRVRSNRNRRAPWHAYKGPLYLRLIQQVEQGVASHTHWAAHKGLPCLERVQSQQNAAVPASRTTLSRKCRDSGALLHLHMGLPPLEESAELAKLCPRQNEWGSAMCLKGCPTQRKGRASRALRSRHAEWPHPDPALRAIKATVHAHRAASERGAAEH